MARSYVDRYAVIAVDDLRISKMVKNHRLARAISDAGWAQFVNIFELEAESAGGQVYKLAPQFPSQLCKLPALAGRVVTLLIVSKSST